MKKYKTALFFNGNFLFVDFSFRIRIYQNKKLDPVSDSDKMTLEPQPCKFYVYSILILLMHACTQPWPPVVANISVLWNLGQTLTHAQKNSSWIVKVKLSFCYILYSTCSRLLLWQQIYLLKKKTLPSRVNFHFETNYKIIAFLGYRLHVFVIIKYF